jgi:hypothetical protein
VQTIFFTFFNGISAGIILAVGFVHSLASSTSRLGAVIVGSSLTDTYGWSAFSAMIGVLFTFTVEECTEGLSSLLGVKDFHNHERDDQESCGDDIPLQEVCDVSSESNEEKDKEADQKENGHSSPDSGATLEEENGNSVKPEQDWSAQPCANGEPTQMAPGQENLRPMLFKMLVLFIGLLGHVLTEFSLSLDPIPPSFSIFSSLHLEHICWSCVGNGQQRRDFVHCHHIPSIL